MKMSKRGKDLLVGGVLLGTALAVAAAAVSSGASVRKASSRLTGVHRPTGEEELV